MSHILIVEDESHLAELERDYLIQAGFAATVLTRGDEVARWLEHNAADLVILDLMLPGRDGLDLCRDLRRQGDVPIIMTTAKVEEIDRLIGLELGADDYLCKPFSLRELVARVKTVLRRSQQSLTSRDSAAPRLYIPDHGSQVCLGQHCIELTVVERNLLQLLMSHPQQIFSRDKIIDRIYTDRRVVSDRTIDSHIKKLRKKLLGLNAEHDYIHSVYGAGYRYQAETETEQP
ncbi:response regulator [Reinekea sp.]|jgi:two-component system response regulator BaeR|uniref:response regulator n=1 Tax=Reinekea sp. TaxID=1970455 RepID=UPI002A833FE5|nr:response regulator [Reinekea sp.]